MGLEAAVLVGGDGGEAVARAGDGLDEGEGVDGRGRAALEDARGGGGGGRRPGPGEGVGEVAELDEVRGVGFVREDDAVELCVG